MSSVYLFMLAGRQVFIKGLRPGIIDRVAAGDEKIADEGV
jgi:hypothetical protein